ncbi:MAG TPA: hypothetical protein VHB21_03285 [Minicystis sp.]|nr:hypothetical protein [Minicystis sp.]
MSAFRCGWSGPDAARFWVGFDACTRAPRSFREELGVAARAVAAAAAKPLWFCSSGGIDSEIMCRVFRDEGIDFHVLTLEHEAGTNRHDTQHAEAFCRAHGLAQEVVRVDMRRFFEIDCEAYAERGFVTGNVFRYLQLRMLELVEERGGHAVLGGGEQLYEVPMDAAVLGEDDVHLAFDVGYAVPSVHAERRGTSHTPYFFFETPELCAAYLATPIVAFAVRDAAFFRHPTIRFMFKRLTYHAAFPDLPPRPKLHGFERLVPDRKRAEARLRARFGSRLEVVRLPVPELRRQLSGGQNRAV